MEQLKTDAELTAAKVKELNNEKAKKNEEIRKLEAWIKEIENDTGKVSDTLETCKNNKSFIEEMAREFLKKKFKECEVVADEGEEEEDTNTFITT